MWVRICIVCVFSFLFLAEGSSYIPAVVIKVNGQPFFGYINERRSQYSYGRYCQVMDRSSKENAGEKTNVNVKELIFSAGLLISYLLSSDR